MALQMTIPYGKHLRPETNDKNWHQTITRRYIQQNQRLDGQNATQIRQSAYYLDQNINSIK